jgi:hypothetical protein
MRNITWFVTIIGLFALLGLPTVVEAQFPAPKPRGKAATQQVVPQPRPLEAQAEAVSPIIVPAPVVNVEPPPSNDFFNWLWTAIAAIFTGSVGKLAFWPPGSKLSGLKLTPEMRAAIDAAAIRAVDSGIPGQVLTAGAGFIPGAGGIVGMLEPMARRAARAALDERLAVNQALAGGLAAPVGPAVTPMSMDDNFLSGLAKKLADHMKDQLAK